MRARILTAAVGIPVLAGLVSFAPPIVFAAIVAALVAIGIVELVTLARAQGIAGYPVLASTAAVLVTLQPWAEVRLSSTPSLSTILAVTVIAGFLGGIGSRHSLPSLLPALGVAVVGVLWVGLLGSYLIRIHALPLGSRWIYLLLSVVWGADAGALLVGRRFGNRKLAPTVSPGKTVEGLFGGIAVAITCALAMRSACDLIAVLPVGSTVALAVLGALAGVAGDLAESAVKRGAAVKDSGTIFPGHGGALDRLDSLLFAAPVMYYGIAILAR